MLTPFLICICLYLYIVQFYYMHFHGELIYCISVSNSLATGLNMTTLSISGGLGGMFGILNNYGEVEKEGRMDWKMDVFHNICICIYNVLMVVFGAERSPVIATLTLFHCILLSTMGLCYTCQKGSSRGEWGKHNFLIFPFWCTKLFHFLNIYFELLSF